MSRHTINAQSPDTVAAEALEHESVWLVRLTDLTLEWAREHAAIRINSHVTCDVSGLDSDEVADQVQHRDRRQYARELLLFARDLQEGDAALGVAGGREQVLVGYVRGPYTYCAEPVNGCRHERRVEWVGITTRKDLRSAGIRLPGLAVRAVARLSTASPAAVDSPRVSRRRSPRPTEGPSDGQRLILSRKGFDSASGGCPSPILPDGSLVSLPIPQLGSGLTYQDVRTGKGTVYDLLRALGRTTVLSGGRAFPLTDRSETHLDPDLQHSARPRVEGWRPLFGQAEAAAAHLRNQGLAVGDLLLFFGLFREAEGFGDGLRWRRGSPAQHVLFGWLEVGDIWRGDQLRPEVVPGWAAEHPHIAAGTRYRDNTVLVAADTISGSPGLPGAGVFTRIHDDLRLSRRGESASRWCLPACFRGRRLTFHSSDSRWSDCDDGVHLDTVGRGQEFVTGLDEPLADWARGLIRRHGS